MLISVIIPTYNRNDLLSECLDLLSPEYQTAKNGYEVIVTDDSKTQAAKQLIEERYQWVRWVEGPHRGPASNRNNGANCAKGDWVLFIDDDCLPDKDVIRAYQTGIQDIPGGKVFEGYTHAGRAKNKFNEEAPVNTEGGYLFSCNFAINLAYFRELKGFDENFPYAAMEDSELAYRIKHQHVKFNFLADAIVLHPWRTKQKSFTMTLKRFSSSIYFVTKYPHELGKYGFVYYLRAFYHSVFYTLKNSFKFKFRGFGMQVVYTVLQLYFSGYMLFYKIKSKSN